MGENELGQKSREALRTIKNLAMKYGRIPSYRELQVAMGYKSPRSAVLLMQELEQNGFLEKREDGSYKMIRDFEEGVHTVEIPLIGTVACGGPILAEENIHAQIPVSTELIKAGSKYFLLKARGNSMDEAGIQDGDLILVKQQSAANNGDHIVALINDEATVKEFQHRGNFVTLVPRSSDKRHQPIILTENFQIQGIVVTVIPNDHF